VRHGDDRRAVRRGHRALGQRQPRPVMGGRSSAEELDEAAAAGRGEVSR
jgi:hypothetical protein